MANLKDLAIETIEQIKYAVWEVDIPSPTVPEYIEHHRDIQNILKFIDEKLADFKAQAEKKGRWILVDDELVHGKCSECGFEAHYYENDVYGEDYCPNCGERLEVDDEDD